MSGWGEQTRQMTAVLKVQRPRGSAARNALLIQAVLPRSQIALPLRTWACKPIQSESV